PQHREQQQQQESLQAQQQPQSPSTAAMEQPTLPAQLGERDLGQAAADCDSGGLQISLCPGDLLQMPSGVQELQAEVLQLVSSLCLEPPYISEDRCAFVGEAGKAGPCVACLVGLVAVV
ncbi:hypothetical protein TSOC_015149, partial [Tetrabaena socialis]